MRLARVITGLDQYSGELTLELLKQGFEVQTSSTGETSSAIPDLEITLSKCAPESAGTLIGDSPSTRDMCVFVTPQAMAGHIRSIDIFVLTPKEKPQGKATDLPGEISKPSDSAKVRPFESAFWHGPTTDTAQSQPTELRVVPPAPAPTSDEQSDESDLVPHGMIWQASNQDELASEASNPSDHAVLHFMPQEENQLVATISSLISAVIKFSDSKLQRMRTSTAKARLGAIFEVPKWFKAAGQKPRKPAAVLPIPPETHTLQKPLKPHNLDEPELNNWKVPRDARLWNAMAMAVAASLLALIAISIAGRFSPSRVSTSATAMSPTLNSSASKLDQVSKSQSGPVIARRKVSPSPASPPIPSKHKIGTKTSTVKRESRASSHRNPDTDYVAKDTTVYFNGRNGLPKAIASPHN